MSANDREIDTLSKANANDRGIDTLSEATANYRIVNNPVQYSHEVDIFKRSSQGNNALTRRSLTPAADARVFKIIVIGDQSVGKTCFIYRFCNGRFLNNPSTTLKLDLIRRNVNVNGEDMILQIWDTIGQERFNALAVSYYRNADGIIFMYDVTRQSTFDNLTKWILESEAHCPSAPKVLVGNKCDGDSVVAKDIAQRFANQHNMHFFETSAMLDSHYDNIIYIFMSLAHKIKDSEHTRRDLSGIVRPAESHLNTKSGCACCN